MEDIKTVTIKIKTSLWEKIKAIAKVNNRDFSKQARVAFQENAKANKNLLPADKR